jgi:hypothetical protein
VSLRRHTPFFACNKRGRIGLNLGKGRATWEHTQGVDLSSLGSMGASERLDDPIGTPTKSHDDWHKATGARPRMGHVIPRDTMIDG